MTNQQRRERRVIKAAMALYEHWVKQADPRFWPEGFWYPLGSKRQAVELGKACKALKVAK